MEFRKIVRGKVTFSQAQTNKTALEIGERDSFSLKWAGRLSHTRGDRTEEFKSTLTS